MDDGEGQEPERDPETLELFIEETVEALQRMERLLIAAEEGRPASDILTVLFRDFHTIKGTSGFLALSRTLEVSHAAEDLLAELRDVGTPPNRTEVAVLVRVVDVIRRMVENLRGSNSEGKVDVKGLVTELHALRDAPHGAPAPAQPIAQPSTPPSAAPTGLPAAAPVVPAAATTPPSYAPTGASMAPEPALSQSPAPAQAPMAPAHWGPTGSRTLSVPSARAPWALAQVRGTG